MQTNSRARTFLSRLILFLAVSLPLGAVTTATASSVASAATCNTTATGNWKYNCTVSEGDSNNMVTAIQRVLAAYGCNPGTVDGIFGTNTFNAVECFQSHRGLSVDGIVGPQTWGSMYNLMKQDYCLSSWCYYYESTDYNYGDVWRQWAPSGVWYVIGLNNTYVQMNFSGPN